MIRGSEDYDEKVNECKQTPSCFAHGKKEQNKYKSRLILDHPGECQEVWEITRLRHSQNAQELLCFSSQKTRKNQKN
jgi:hypothetical protein